MEAAGNKDGGGPLEKTSKPNLRMRRISYERKKMWAERLQAGQNRMCVGCSVGRSGKGCGNFALKEGRLWDICKQMHNEMLWVDCVSPEKHMGVLTPRTSEYDLT